MKTHEDLDAWKFAITMVTEIYQLTGNFPDHEKFGLINQIRRASVSVPSNIAEGAARQSKKEYIRFLYISLGSVSELETQFIISQNLNYISTAEYEKINDQLNKIRRLLVGLIKYVKKSCNE